MSTIWKRAIAATTIALVAGFGITACSTGDNTKPESSKGSASQQPEGKKDDGGGALTADNFVQRITDAQQKAGTAEISQSMTVQGQTVATTGQMKIDKDPKKIAMSMTSKMPDGSQMEIRIVDGVTYMNLGAMTDNKFAKLDGAGSQLEKQLGTSQADVTAQLGAFKTALVDFKQDGSEKLDGVDAARYVLTLDTAKLFKAMGNEVPAESKLGKTINYEMFIGSDDLVRRYKMDVAGTPVQVDYSKWGEPLDIVAPTADQLTDKKLPF